MGDEHLQMLDLDERVHEWEDGLPSPTSLPPLSHNLISPNLASAFRISPHPSRTTTDLDLAIHTTLSIIRRPTSKLTNDPIQVVEPEPEASSSRIDDDNDEEEVENDLTGCCPSSKRARLVWTPQLHKRFVDVVAHLGVKNAVPKTIMQLMNVEGLTRENVASHLQKYRLYLKRMQGLSNEGPSSSDPLFATTPVPRAHEYSVGGINVPLHPMAHGMVRGVGMGHGHHGHSSDGGGNRYYSMYKGEQQRDWSANVFNPIVPYAYVNQNDK